VSTPPLTAEEAAPSREAFWLRLIANAVKTAEHEGFIVTVDRVPQTPLAMRNHTARVTIYPKR
jgi:hypothetical protein